MRFRSWFDSNGPWWGSYPGVASLAFGAGLLVLLFVLANAAEILKALKTAGG